MKLPRMSLHVGDYLKDTGHLRAPEHGAYLMLVMHYWVHDCLPNDDRQLAAIARMTDREWKASKSVLQSFFKPGWKHSRVEREKADAIEKYNKRARAGKKGGEAKAEAKQSSSNATAYEPSIDQAYPNPNPNLLRDSGGGDARAREPSKSLISAEAYELVVEILSLAKLSDDDPMAIGGAYEVQAWLNEGATPEIIRIACQRSLANKRDGPPSTFKYFAKAVAREKATAGQALPKVQISEAEVIHVNRTARPGSAWDAAGERVLAAIRSAGAGEPRADCEGNSRAAPREIDARLLSKG